MLAPRSEKDSFVEKAEKRKANQRWNGRLYEIQMMYDNHTASCVQDGP